MVIAAIAPIVPIAPISLIALIALISSINPLTPTTALARDEPAAAASRRMADGKQWTTRNLSVKIDQSYCYENADENCEKYGRLYTWDAAQRACPSLGAGWRLPTDDEWRQLAKPYGGVSADAADEGKSAYSALIRDGRSGFNAVLGGGREPNDGTYARGAAHGFYWTSTSTPGDVANAVFYNFGRGGQALHRQPEGEKQNAFSVRCIKD